MKTSLRMFLFKLLKVAGWLFLLLNVLALILDAHLRNSSIFKVNLIFNRSIPENVILGSSKPLTGIDTKVLSEKTNLRWLNLSIDDTPIETHLLVFDLLQLNNHKVKNIILQYDASHPYKDTSRLNDRDYQFLPFAYFDNGVIWNYIKYRENGIGAALYLVPVLKYAYYNTELFFPAIYLLFNPSYRHRFDEIGDYSYPLISFTSHCHGNHNFDVNLNNSAFLEFVECSTLHNANLIVYTAPLRCMNVKTNIPNNFIYLNYSSIFKQDSLFNDEIHINKLGKKKLTVRMSSDILHYIN